MRLVIKDWATQSVIAVVEGIIRSDTVASVQEQVATTHCVPDDVTLQPRPPAWLQQRDYHGNLTWRLAQGDDWAGRTRVMESWRTLADCGVETHYSVLYACAPDVVDREADEPSPVARPEDTSRKVSQFDSRDYVYVGDYHTHDLISSYPVSTVYDERLDAFEARVQADIDRQPKFKYLGINGWGTRSWYLLVGTNGMYKSDYQLLPDCTIGDEIFRASRALCIFVVNETVHGRNHTSPAERPEISPRTTNLDGAPVSRGLHPYADLFYCGRSLPPYKFDDAHAPAVSNNTG